MPEQSFRSIRGVLLDASIPVIRVGADSVTNLHAALDKSKGKETTWSHPQVAVSKEQLDLKTLGFSKTRLAIPLPGESWGTASYRHGELHAHEAGPFLLIHKDESAPGSGLFAHLTKDVPEALRRRFSGKITPFVQEKPMVNRELQKVAMATFVDEYKKIAFTTSEYAGPMGTVPFQQASQVPVFKVPGLKTAIEKTQQKIADDSGLATYGKHMALNAGQALRDTKGIFSHPIAQYVAPEGGPKRLLSSVALSVPNIAGDLYNVAVPPQLTHTKDELKGLGGASAGAWFRRGAGMEEKKAAMLRSGKLPPVFAKEKGVLGRAGQLLSGERALALKTYKERYESHAGRLARRAAAHERSGSVEYAGALKRDAEITSRAAGRIGKLHGAEAAKSTAARAGVVGTATGAGFAAGKASEDKEAGALTPAGRLAATQRKGTGMGASVSGPSIAEVAKPPRIGHAMPGALKNQI